MGRASAVTSKGYPIRKEAEKYRDGRFFTNDKMSSILESQVMERDSPVS
jgi:hypothetical protein